MFAFLLVFLLFYGFYFYYGYKVFQLTDVDQILSQTATKAQEDLKDYSDLLLNDLNKCYINVLLIIAVATFITFLWIILLKYNARAIIWLSIVSVPALLSCGLWYSVRMYISLVNAGNDTALSGGDGGGDIYLPSEQSLSLDKALQNILTEELMYYVHNETLWLCVSMVLALVLAVLLLIMYALKRRIKLSITLIRQASKAINGVKSTLLFPFIPRLLGIAMLTFGVLVSLLIMSASHPTYSIEGGPRHGQPCHPRFFNRTTAAIPQRPRLAQADTNVAATSRRPQTMHLYRASVDKADSMDRLPASAHQADFLQSNAQPAALQQQQQQQRCVAHQTLSRKHVWKYHALNLFATLWMLQFISGVSQTTLAGAFASYYWAYRKPPFFAVTASLFRVIRHHLGDIAFGSLLIATIRYIRIVIEFVTRRVRGKSQGPAAAATDPATAMMGGRTTCCLRVFFWLLDRFLKYIDRNAYIMMSMYGEGYLKSAKRAVELLYENTTRALVLDYVSCLVLLVSRLLITGLAAYIAAQELITENLHYKWLPLALVVAGTYFVTKGLFNVYSMAVETLFICYLIEMKMKSSQMLGSTTSVARQNGHERLRHQMALA